MSEVRKGSLITIVSGKRAAASQIARKLRKLLEKTGNKEKKEMFELSNFGQEQYLRECVGLKMSIESLDVLSKYEMIPDLPSRSEYKDAWILLKPAKEGKKWLCLFLEELP